MERLFDFIKWSVIGLLLLVLLWAALAATKWLPQPTAAERNALAILNTPPTVATGQHNAFDAIWLWKYDIPPADLAKVANADLARYRASVTSPFATFVSSAEGRYRRRELADDYAQLLCPANVTDCLAQIRTHKDATRQFLDVHALLLDHARSLWVDDFYHDRLPPNPANPSPELGGIGMLLLGDAALRFADGDRPEGLARACTAALTWRRLALHSDSRVVQAVAGGYYIGASELVAGMRAELPADTLLPGPCNEAFEPITDAVVDVCDVMKIDFAKNAVALREIRDPVELDATAAGESRWARMLGRLLINDDAAIAYSAPAYASFCTSDGAIQHAAERIDETHPLAGCGVQGALFDPIGCSLAVVGNPRRSPQMLRIRDMQRMNILVRAALIQQAQAGTGQADRTSGKRSSEGVTEDASRHTLRIQRAYRLFEESAEFTIPLPGSRLH